MGGFKDRGVETGWFRDMHPKPPRSVCDSPAAVCLSVASLRLIFE